MIPEDAGALDALMQANVTQRLYEQASQHVLHHPNASAMEIVMLLQTEMQHAQQAAAPHVRRLKTELRHVTGADLDDATQVLISRLRELAAKHWEDTSDLTAWRELAGVVEELRGRISQKRLAEVRGPDLSLNDLTKLRRRLTPYGDHPLD